MECSGSIIREGILGATLRISDILNVEGIKRITSF